MQPGDYTVPFEFTLPRGIPSSMLFNRPEMRGMPVAVIKYHLRVKLITASTKDKEIFYKQVLIVREPATNFAVAINQMNECKITTWCCMN